MYVPTHHMYDYFEKRTLCGCACLRQCLRMYFVGKLFMWVMFVEMAAWDEGLVMDLVALVMKIRACSRDSDISSPCGPHHSYNNMEFEIYLCYIQLRGMHH